MNFFSCCWQGQGRCAISKASNESLSKCTECSSCYHRLCADQNCPARESLGKLTECGNCTGGKQHPVRVARSAASAARRAAKANQRDEGDEVGPQQKKKAKKSNVPSKKARAQQRSASLGAAQPGAITGFLSPGSNPAAAAAPLPPAATKAAAAAAEKPKNRRHRRGPPPKAPKGTPPMDKLLDPAEEFLVETLLATRIVDSRGKAVKDATVPGKGQTRQFQVKWKGYPDDGDNTWENEENVNAPATRAFFGEGQQGATFAARIPKSYHPSHAGYRTARHMVGLNKMIVATRGGEKRGTGSAAATGSGATMVTSAQTKQKADGACNAAAAAAAVVIVPEPKLKEYQQKWCRAITAVLKDLDAVVKLSKLHSRIDLSALDLLAKQEWTRQQAKIKGAFDALPKAIKCKMDPASLHLQPPQQYDQDGAAFSFVAAVQPPTVKTGLVMAPGWVCSGCTNEETGQFLTAHTKEKMLWHFVSKDHNKVLAQKNSQSFTLQDREAEQQQSRTVITEFREAVGVGVAQHSLPFTAGVFTSAMAQKMIMTITGGQPITTSQIAEARKHIPALVPMLQQLRTLTVLAPAENNHEQLMPLVMTKNAVAKQVSSSGKALRDTVKVEQEAAQLVCLIVDESTTDGAGSKPAYVVTVTCSPKFVWIVNLKGQVNVGVGNMSGEKYTEHVMKLVGPVMWCKTYLLSTDGCHSMRSDIEHAGHDGNGYVGESFLAYLKRETPFNLNPAGHHCFGHILNLALQDMISHWELDLMISWIPFLQKMSTRLRKSAPKTDVFARMNEQFVEYMRALAEAFENLDAAHGWQVFSLSRYCKGRWIGLHAACTSMITGWPALTFCKTLLISPGAGSGMGGPPAGQQATADTLGQRDEG